MKPWEVYIVDVKFEDSDDRKKRPVLITTDGKAYQLGFKMTTLNRFGDLDYPLQDWQGVGLIKPTIVRLSKKVPIPMGEEDIKYIGEIQPIDKKEILRLCDKYKIEKDDLTESRLQEKHNEKCR